MKKTISLFYQNQQKSNGPIKIDRFANEIENFRRYDNLNTLSENPVLFIGSSSIVHWETSVAFPEFPVINRGFGGASIPEIIHYYNDVIKKYSPSVLVVYCDIDIENGESPDIAVIAFKVLVNKVKKDFPEAQIIILSIKPSLIDAFLGKDVRKNKIITNKQLLEYCNDESHLHFADIYTPMLNPDSSLRSDIFLSDRMHMNSTGYALWNQVLRGKIESLLNKNC